MSSMKNLKRKYGTSKFVSKKSKSSPSSLPFVQRQNRVIRLGRGPEQKVIDTPAAGYVCDTTGTVTFINGAAQGVDFNQCLDRKYLNTTVQLEGSIQPLDTTTGPTKCRVMIVYDEQPNGAVPAITDILTASTSNAFMNLNNRDRFKIVMDINETIGGVSNTATQAYAQSPTVFNVSKYRKLSLPSIRNGAAATAAITNYSTGSLLLVTIGDQAPGAGGSYVGAVRVRFQDD